MTKKFLFFVSNLAIAINRFYTIGKMATTQFQDLGCSVLPPLVLPYLSEVDWASNTVCYREEPVLVRCASQEPLTTAGLWESS